MKFLTPAVVLVLLLLSMPSRLNCSAADEPSLGRSAPQPLTSGLKKVAVDRAKVIANETFGVLSSNLQFAIQSGGLTNAVPFCAVVAPPLTRGVANKHGVSLRRFSHKARNLLGRANEVELSVLKSFQALLVNNTNPPPAFATNLIAGKATVFAPIVIQNEVCLKCHGVPGREIHPDVHSVIRRHYPEDQATGFSAGQLRGAWRIDIPLSQLQAD